MQRQTIGQQPCRYVHRFPSEEALASAALRFFRSSLTGGCARRARSSDAFFAALRPRQPKPQLADSSDVQPMQTQQAQSVTAEQLGIFKPVDTEGDTRDSAKTSTHIPDSGKEENRSTHAQAPKKLRIHRWARSILASSITC